MRALSALLLGAVLCELGLRGAGWVYYATSGRSAEGAMGEAGLEILCAGDSNTFGIFETAESAYPARLERLLDERVAGGPHRVVNLGMPGLNSRQLRQGLARELADRDPAAVIVLVGANNAWSWITGSEYAYEEPPWYEELRLFKLARLARFALAGESGAAGPDGRALPGDLQATELEDRRGAVLEGTDRTGRRVRYDSVPREEKLADEELHASIRTDFAALRELTAERGIPLLVLTYAGEYENYDRVNGILRAVAAELELPLVDCGREVAPYLPRFGFEQLFYPDHHPRGTGYELVARSVYDALIAHGVAEGEPIEDLAEGLRPEERPPPPLRFAGDLAGGPGNGHEPRLEIAGEEPGRPFRIFLSFEREGEPARIRGLRLPLVDDSLFRLTLEKQPLAGVLDAAGNGSVSLLPLISPANGGGLPGMRVRALYVLFVDESRLKVRWISDPVELTLE